jgi:hypothetical protein
MTAEEINAIRSGAEKLRRRRHERKRDPESGWLTKSTAL